MTTTDGTETLTLVNGRLIDGTGAAPQADAVVVIRNGHIVGVGARRRVDHALGPPESRPAEPPSH